MKLYQSFCKNGWYSFNLYENKNDLIKRETKDEIKKVTLIEGIRNRQIAENNPKTNASDSYKIRIIRSKE